MQNTLGPTSLFRLPPELRVMIWKLLLPSRRVLKARSSGATMDPRRIDDRRFVFGFDSKVSQPILSQICAESRQCLLDYGNGQFVFGLEGEAGLWWGPQDVLLFDQEWCLRWATPSLQGLKSLDFVKNIALDATQAQYIYYEYVLPEDDETSQDDSDGSDQGDFNEENDGDSEPTDLGPQALLPQSITVGYMSRTDRPHFLEYFTALNKLMIVFEPITLFPMGSTNYYSAPAEWGPISQFLDKPCHYGWVTFDRDGTNMADAVGQVSELRRFWAHTSSLNYWSYCKYDDTFNESHVLYDFCIDRSRTGLAYEPTRVTCFDMMDDGDWAL
jgi:hypothetical protein